MRSQLAHAGGRAITGAVLTTFVVGFGACFPSLPPEDVVADVAADTAPGDDTTTTDTVTTDTVTTDTVTTDTVTTDTATTDTATTDTATTDTATTDTETTDTGSDVGPSACDTVVCGNGGTCSETEGGAAECICPTDFTPIGLRCVASNGLIITNLPGSVSEGLEKAGAFVPTISRPEGIPAPVWSYEVDQGCPLDIAFDTATGTASWFCPKEPATCSVTISVAAAGLSDAADLEIICFNTPPTVTNVRVVPDVITTIGEELTCAWDFVDPDPQGEYSRVVWLVDGVPAGEGMSFSNYGGNAKIACGVYPNDGLGEGELVLSMDVYAPQDMRYFVYTGGYSTCALRDGKVACWGRYGWGTGTGDASSAPKMVADWASGVSAVSVGLSHVCAIQQGALSCMGNNGSGQIGVTTEFGTGTLLNAPFAVPGLETNVTAVATGFGHTCAIQAGALYCFGRNADGELGVGGNADSPTPILVPGFDVGVTEIGISGSSGTTTCAIRAGGLYCWGSFTDGEVTNIAGSRGNAPPVAPTVVPGFESGVTGVSMGPGHICVETVFATYCWGSNYYGQCTDPTVETTTAVGFTSIANSTTTVTELAAGGRHTCAAFSGVLHCWGWNVYGQLGQGWVAEDPSVRSVGLPTPGAVFGFEALSVTSVAAGYEHTCAATLDGVWCWGKNQYGELGNPTNFSTFQANPMPAQVTLPN